MALSSLPGDACSPLTNLDDAGSGLPAGHWSDLGGAMEATRAGKGSSRLITSGRGKNATGLQSKLGERARGAPPTGPCLPLTGREPGSQEEVGRAAPGGTGRWPPEHANVEDSKDANGGLGTDQARPLCQDGARGL